MSLKRASKKDMEWVNNQYKEIGFVESNFDDEIIIVVEYEGNYAGLGRIVNLKNNEAEMGGIYILDKYRGLSLARKLVEGLIDTARLEGYKTIYCLPFENLKSFYGSFGFVEIDSYVNVNDAILKKHTWCNDNYEIPVLLLKLDV